MCNNKRFYFIGVNYGTSNLIIEWANNIRSFKKNALLIIVDNFKNESERCNIKKITIDNNIILIESDNVGYGQGLNKAIQYCIDLEKENEFIVFAGNLDIKYVSLPSILPSGKYVYIPLVKESTKNNLNPFLTYAQSKVLPMYMLVGYTKSIVLLYLIVIINKIISKFPSRIWTIHGSLFCFNSRCIKKNEPIFNENSFLYCEEIEFGSYMESHQVEFFLSDIEILHSEHVATSDLITSKQKFIEIWWPSFLSWYRKWK
jgi:GT2 family glycosyltransferase